MSEAGTFQRAYSLHHKQQRAADLIEAARTLGARGGVRTVTLTAIATQAGVHASAVRRYYASREEIPLTLAEEGYTVTHVPLSLEREVSYERAHA
jgi:AcrR family transcriptional regulator